MSTDITLSDYLSIRNVAFDWAESYDSKDWSRLRHCLAPSVTLDFRTLQGTLHENLSPDDYVKILQNAIGDRLLKTQHLLGAAKWECLSDGAILVSHQARVAHIRYKDESLTDVENKGHAHGFVQHRYRKFEGTWKLELCAPGLVFSEYDIFGTLGSKVE